jgi:hypothetical protein
MTTAGGLTYLTAYLDECGRKGGKPLNGRLKRFLPWNANPEDLRTWAQPPPSGVKTLRRMSGAEGTALPGLLPTFPVSPVLFISTGHKVCFASVWDDGRCASHRADRR